MSHLLPWEEALDRVLTGVSPLPAVDRPVLEAHDMALAGPVTAPEPMPPFDNSAMDGFAVRAADVAGASTQRPIQLDVIDTLPAGRGESKVVRPGTAIRVMTGAPIPKGADAVVPVEDTQFWDESARRSRLPESPEEARRVRIHAETSAGRHVRRAGESVRKDQRFLEAGHRLRGAEIALLISVGVKLVSVHPLPRVAVLSTGDELVGPQDPLRPGQIRDSNRAGLLLRLREFGFVPVDLGLVRDDPRALETRILDARKRFDFLITSGGVSAGDYDFTRDVLGKLGRVRAYQVAVKPGKPQVFGHLGDTPVFGLPGNPVSSMVVFDQFVHPALRRLAGREPVHAPRFNARLDGPIRRRAGRTEFIRVRLTPENGEWVASVSGPQGSGVLRSMTLADGYAIIPPEVGELEAGAILQCQHMRWD